MCRMNVETATNFPNRLSGGVDTTWREAADVGQTARNCWCFLWPHLRQRVKLGGDTGFI